MNFSIRLPAVRYTYDNEPYNIHVKHERNGKKNTSSNPPATIYTDRLQPSVSVQRGMLGVSQKEDDG